MDGLVRWSPIGSPARDKAYGRPSQSMVSFEEYMHHVLGDDWDFTEARCAYVRKLQGLITRHPNVPSEQVEATFNESGNNPDVSALLLGALDNQAAARRGAFGFNAARKLQDIPAEIALSHKLMMSAEKETAVREKIAAELGAMLPNEVACTLAAMPTEFLTPEREEYQFDISKMVLCRGLALETLSPEVRANALMAVPLSLRGDLAEEYGERIAPSLVGLPLDELKIALAALSAVDRAAVLASMSPDEEAVALGVMSHADRAVSLAVIVEMIQPMGRGARLAIMSPEERAGMLVAMPPGERAATLATLTAEERAATVEPMLWTGALPWLDACCDDTEEPLVDVGCRGSCVYCGDPVMDTHERMKSKKGYAHYTCVVARKGNNTAVNQVGRKLFKTRSVENPQTAR